MSPTLRPMLLASIAARRPAPPAPITSTSWSWVSLTTADFNLIGHHVYKSLGFKEEGRMLQSLKRDGTYHDQIMMYMLRNDWSKDKPI